MTPPALFFFKIVLAIQSPLKFHINFKTDFFFCVYKQQGPNVYWSGQLFPSSEDLPNPGIKPMSPTLQTNSLPAEPPGKPKNTGVGSLSLPQWIFLTQESNRGLLHCRWILYQLSYQGSHWDFDRDCTESVDQSYSLSSIDILTILSFNS